jgi:hypothetical protein
MVGSSFHILIDRSTIGMCVLLAFINNNPFYGIISDYHMRNLPGLLGIVNFYCY